MQSPDRFLTQTFPALLLVVSASVTVAFHANAAIVCPAERPAPLFQERDHHTCRAMADDIRRPGAQPLDRYQAKLKDFLGKFCHRDPRAGWRVDKRVRDTGPFIAPSFGAAPPTGSFGTHLPVVIYYSPEMFAWLKKNRPEEGNPRPAPVPDGAMMIKEMYPAPAALCADINLNKLYPVNGAAIMVRDNSAAWDGWFWGWFGWGSQWKPDWPADEGHRYPTMGFGQYCTNCHASAVDNLTFASLKNIAGEKGEPPAYYVQNSPSAGSAPGRHATPSDTRDDATYLRQAPLPAYDPAFTETMKLPLLRRPSSKTVARMASMTYDNVWVARGSGKGAGISSTFLTSDQCLGCHDAGSTGLQYDMTAPGPGGKLLNHSPYGTWSTSPMGLGGRDPVFYAQLASETEAFHLGPGISRLLQDICLGCHGIMGQRQHKIDQGGGSGDSKCGPFLRGSVAVTPYPGGSINAESVRYGALARDGVSCVVCHRMVLGEANTEKYENDAQNRCVAERQAFLNPDNRGFARTFTGSFLVGPPEILYGPFRSPRQKPMVNALGIRPEHNPNISRSELCGTCHTVHLPVLHNGRELRTPQGKSYRVYEQTTYAEWAFSDYRTGETADGALPLGKGRRAQSCQGCHMTSRDADGKPVRSKIASIQEYSNFPETENNLGPRDIDLPVREGFAKHTLVGLNLFLVKMAQQFPDILGMRTQSPMLTSKGLDPAIHTEQAMLDQARHSTARVDISGIEISGSALQATVTVTNKTGHKFPSGVGFRRAFIQFEVLDAEGTVLWASGRTNGVGVITDEKGNPLDGELWWKDDCSARLNPLQRRHQPHYQVINRQNQAQIYQELVAAPPASQAIPICGREATPSGMLTTSFLSICNEVKDNRLLPHGFLALDDRARIAAAIGAGANLARETSPHLPDPADPERVQNDPEYLTGGGDSLVYRVDLSNLPRRPAAVRATLYYQATPPFYLQDRFCTSKSEDTRRLYYIAGHLNLNGTEAEGWKLKVVTTGAVRLP